MAAYIKDWTKCILVECGKMVKDSFRPGDMRTDSGTRVRRLRKKIPRYIGIAVCRVTVYYLDTSTSLVPPRATTHWYNALYGPLTTQHHRPPHHHHHQQQLPL